MPWPEYHYILANEIRDVDPFNANFQSIEDQSNDIDRTMLALEGLDYRNFDEDVCSYVMDWMTRRSTAVLTANSGVWTCLVIGGTPFQLTGPAGAGFTLAANEYMMVRGSVDFETLAGVTPGITALDTVQLRISRDTGMGYTGWANSLVQRIGYSVNGGLEGSLMCSYEVPAGVYLGVEMDIRSLTPAFYRVTNASLYGVIRRRVG